MFQRLVDTGSCTSAQNVLRKSAKSMRDSRPESPSHRPPSCFLLFLALLTLLTLWSEDWLSSSKYSSNRRSSAWEITSYSTSEMILTCRNHNHPKSERLWYLLLQLLKNLPTACDNLEARFHQIMSTHVNSIKDPARPAHTDWKDSCHSCFHNFGFPWCYNFYSRVHDFLLSQASLTHLYRVSTGNIRSHKEAPWLISTVSRYLSLSLSLSQSIRSTLRKWLLHNGLKHVKTTLNIHPPIGRLCFAGNAVRQVVLALKSAT